MRILFIGDIVGRLGRTVTTSLLPTLKQRANLDLILANAENIAHGRGGTETTIKEMQEVGINYFTSGNHIFWHKGFVSAIENLPVLRPANYPDDVAGQGIAEINLGKKGRILLINLLGRTFINSEATSCFFRKADEILNQHKRKKFSAIIVDIHAETTSEKNALGFYLDGRVSAVVGTHTHVPTCDHRILPKGTAFISDVGMVGALNSVLGVRSDIIIRNQMLPYPQKFEWDETGEGVFNSVLIEIDEKTGLGKKIERIDKVLNVK